MQRFHRTGLICLGLVIFISAVSFSQGQEKGPAEKVPLALETFDAVWGILNENHFDTNFSGVDWNAARARYRPKAEAAKSSKELRDTIQEMLDLLKLSHLAIISSDLAEEVDPKHRANGKKSTSLEPPSEDESGTFGFDVRLSGKDLLVSRVWPESPAAKAGVKPGWLLFRIGATEFKKPIGKVLKKFKAPRANFLIWRMASGYIRGPVGSKADVQFLDGANKKTTVKIERDPLPGDAIQFGSLPTLYTELKSEMLRPKENFRVGYIRFNIWMLPAAIAFNNAIDEFRGADGMIIDLRGNIGGVAGMVMGVSGHFFDKHLSLGKMKMRDGELTFFVNPRFSNAAGQRVKPYSGPLAILVDEISVSASELFAGGFQDLGRAHVFGSPTTGQALPAFMDKLPNGDILYHPFADLETEKGTRFEGRGVIPDVAVPLKRDDLLAGRDAALQAALQWLVGSPEAPGLNH